MITPEMITRWKTTYREIEKLQCDITKLEADIMPLKLQLSQHVLGLTGTAGSIELDELTILATVKVVYDVTRAEIDSIAERMTDAERMAVTWKPVIDPEFYKCLPADSILRTVVKESRHSPHVEIWDPNI